MMAIVNRDTFVVPEIKIFEAVVKWYSKNKDASDSLKKCVRYSLINTSDQLSIVWPTGFINQADLIESLAQRKGAKVATVSERRKLCKESYMPFFTIFNPSTAFHNNINASLR